MVGISLTNLNPFGVVEYICIVLNDSAENILICSLIRMMQSFTIVNVVEMDKKKYYIIHLEQFQCRGVPNVQDLCIYF